VQRAPYAVISLAPAALSIRSPGGGGYGEPIEREPDAVLRDVRDGVVSRLSAEKDYGVILSADGRQVDRPATLARRAGTQPVQGKQAIDRAPLDAEPSSWPKPSSSPKPADEPDCPGT
jgi:hypothetical protein